MKRDWDIIRDILVRLEDLPNTDTRLGLDDFPEEQHFKVSYQVQLLLDARLVEGKMFHTLGNGPVNFVVIRLTWTGHEFLDAVKSDTVWAKTKQTFASKGIDMTFDLVKSVASGITVAIVRGAAGV